LSDFSITTLTPKEYSYWNLLVAEHTQPTIFHTTVFFEAYGIPIFICLVKKKAHPVLGFICSENNNTTIRPEFVPYFGVAIFLDNVRSTLFYADIQKAYAILISYLKKRYLKISVRLAPSVSDIQAFIWAGFDIRVRYTYLVNIQNLEVAFANFDDNLKRQIKKCLKHGVEVLYHKNVLDYTDLFRATREKQKNFFGLLAKYQQYLLSINCCNTMVIQGKNGKPLAAIFIVWDKQRAYYLLGGYRNTSEEDNKSYTALALWEAMKFTREQLGLYEFDLEGSMIPGVENFFRKFGGTKVPYYQLLYRKKGAITGLLSAFLKRI
jgi:hypothetical protein